MDGSAEVPARAGDWMVTYTGRIFWPLDPRADDVDIRDIAHHLARTCRWNGSVKNYYSVAEHCVMLAAHFIKSQQPALARWALLHDAAEAYIGDVIRPLKADLPGYKDIEARLEETIWSKYGLFGDMPAVIKAADTAILGDEREQLFLDTSPERMKRREGEVGIGIRLAQWSPQQAETEFMGCFRVLFREFA